MFYRKEALIAAVAGLLASAGFAMADSTQMQAPSLSITPTVVTADDAVAPAPDMAPPSGLLMQGLDKANVGQMLEKYKINISGFIEGGYTYNHRHDHSNYGGVVEPGPFNHEYGNHLMLNQLDLQIERKVDGKTWDVGGKIEVMYGSDAARIHSTGLGFNGSDPTDNDQPFDPKAVANLHPIWQFDLTQAYVDVGVPVGNGLIVRAGKFVTLLGYETINPTTNPLYSHSYLFSMVPFTQTGIYGIYKINDQWTVKGGISRGWDQTLEDGNAYVSRCDIDTFGQVVYTINPQLTAQLTWSVGPENAGDSSHYRTAIDPIVRWQATKQLSLGAEGLYVYDGGRNGDVSYGGTTSHAYGDSWGLALYGGYMINDFVTANLRAEGAHFDDGAPGLEGSFGSDSYSYASYDSSSSHAVCVYEVTAGVTVTPFPKDPIGKNLSIRPEVRYDYSADHLFGNGSGNSFRDQLSFGADVIFKF